MNFLQYGCTDVIQTPVENPISATWYHGTKSEPRFDQWICPPPPQDPLVVAHSALFFTSDLDFAKSAGENVCTVALSGNAKLLVPAVESTGSRKLRRALRESDRLSEHCIWLTDEKLWRQAWSTGDVMRFAFDNRRADSVAHYGAIMNFHMRQLREALTPTPPDELLSKIVRHNLTRGWIEKIVSVARSLGYQAIQGAEIDRWTEPGRRPVARPWLAVTDKSAISPPTWI